MFSSRSLLFLSTLSVTNTHGGTRRRLGQSLSSGLWQHFCAPATPALWAFSDKRATDLRLRCKNIKKKKNNSWDNEERTWQRGRRNKGGNEKEGNADEKNRAEKLRREEGQKTRWGLLTTENKRRINESDSFSPTFSVFKVCSMANGDY